MSDGERLLTKEVAAVAGLRTDTIRKYRVRGSFPPPDGHDFGHPWWRRETIDRWLHRRGKSTLEVEDFGCDEMGGQE